jgi:hypothetical protein
MTVEMHNPTDDTKGFFILGSSNNVAIQIEEHNASSIEFNAGNIVRPTSKANGFGIKGARNFNQASIPDMEQTNPSHNVDNINVVKYFALIAEACVVVNLGIRNLPTTKK